MPSSPLLYIIGSPPPLRPVSDADMLITSGPFYGMLLYRFTETQNRHLKIIGALAKKDSVSFRDAAYQAIQSIIIERKMNIKQFVTD